ncbi:tetratricopeptide repeat protein [Paraliomyxa miuraensis]|uniref:tetratricopeptide repeat protein n=1 Tax=Paraliomyxa miuraensis TaxID=376150 RepID=UPI002257967C|nr:tetratricopeptide repeat protein [Paraliomyxa miuraensis]MCX4243907.1 tetratricopeptide repeat protein [Paraliomyxa miuraensis]
MPWILRGGALLGLGLAACTRVINPPLTHPPEPPPIDVVAVEAELERAAALLAKAEADGKLDPRECAEVTAAFRATHDPAHPSTAQGLFDAGVVWERCGNVDEAKAAYRQTLAVAPEHAGAHNNLGVLQWAAGDRAAAADSFERAVRADPSSPEARNNQAAAVRERYLQSGSADDFAKAELALRNALAVDSDNPVSHENLARLYYDRGRLHERSYLLLAKLVVTQATRVLEEHGHSSAELYNLHGLLLMEDHDQVAALRAFRKATELEPDHAEAHLNVAMIALRFRDYATAEESLTRALGDRDYERNVTAWLGLGVAQRGLRRYGDAKKTLLRTRDLDGADPRALYNLGLLYHEHIAPSAPQDPDPRKFDDTAYLDARRFFERFVSEAAKAHPQEVADARMRIAGIDRFLEDVKDMAKLQADVEAAEAEAARLQEEERQRLLEVERRAKAAQATQGS